jgi:uracil-DNA glycosylase family 4
MTNSVKLISGEGRRDAEIVFVGEAPGQEEDEQGRPFVGRSGKVLERWLEYMGLDRGDVWITNIVKVMPDNNRTPTYDEILSWKDLLMEELETVNPWIVVPVGASATKALLGKDFDKFAPERGKFCKTERWNIFPIYHPSYILRSPGAEKLALADLDTLKEALRAKKENDLAFIGTDRW